MKIYVTKKEVQGSVELKFGIPKDVVNLTFCDPSKDNQIRLISAQREGINEVDIVTLAGISLELISTDDAIFVSDTVMILEDGVLTRSLILSTKTGKDKERKIYEDTGNTTFKAHVPNPVESESTDTSDTSDKEEYSASDCTSLETCRGTICTMYSNCIYRKDFEGKTEFDWALSKCRGVICDNYSRCNHMLCTEDNSDNLPF